MSMQATGQIVLLENYRQTATTSIASGIMEVESPKEVSQRRPSSNSTLLLSDLTKSKTSGSKPAFLGDSMANEYVVYGSDIYVYHPESDDANIKTGACIHCKNIRMARVLALRELEQEYNDKKEQINKLLPKKIL